MTAGPDPLPEPGPAGRTARRAPRRAVRPGSGEPDPAVALRSDDDSDVGWQAVGDESNDDRLRRDVPPHW